MTNSTLCRENNDDMKKKNLNYETRLAVRIPAVLNDDIMGLCYLYNIKRSTFIRDALRYYVAFGKNHANHIQA
jgi:metal-responsive CopG/Arc/MetJ family transcriptional regulator